MARKESEHFFGGDIDIRMWERFETWAKGRGKLSNRQIQSALFRLFLAAPEGIQLCAFTGKDDEVIGEGLKRIIRDLLPVFGLKVGGLLPAELAVIWTDQEKEEALGAILQYAGPDLMRKIPDLVHQALAAAPQLKIAAPEDKDTRSKNMKLRAGGVP
jgi:hypothetical protein